MAVLAPHLLALLGNAYAAAGTTPLRILLVSVFPLAFTQAYFAISRARQRLGEAILIGVVTAGVSVLAAAIGGATHGLEGIAVGWTVTQSVTGVICLQRIRAMWRPEVPAAPPVAAGMLEQMVD